MERCKNLPIRPTARQWFEAQGFGDRIEAFDESPSATAELSMKPVNNEESRKTHKRWPKALRAYALSLHEEFVRNYVAAHRERPKDKQVYESFISGMKDPPPFNS